MKAMVLEDPDWMADAIATIIGLSHTQEILTADDVGMNLRKPPHPNNVGAAFLAAKTAGFIEPVSYTTSTSKTRKNGALRVWRRKINEGVAA